MASHGERDAPDDKILRFGKDIFRQARKEAPGIFNAKYWHGQVLDWAMKDPSFKVDLLRFVDVLPSLARDEQVVSHAREYLLRDNRKLPATIKTALKMITGSFTGTLGAKAIRANVLDMARHFIAGTNTAEVLPVLKGLHADGIAFTVDILGEATLSDSEAHAYRQRYLDLIDGLAEEVPHWPASDVIDNNHLGPIPRANVSIKISAMDPRLSSADPAGGVARLKMLILPIFLRARERNIFVNFDLEQWAVNQINYDLFEEIVTDPALRDWPHVGIVLQAYLRKSQAAFERILSIAKGRGAPITVRLVKGAYWDYEVANALLHGYPCPVFTEKARTDANYERLSERLLDNIEHLHPAFASHNLRSLSHAIVMADEKVIPPNAYELQLLYGMAEPERKALRATGRRVRLYVPSGAFLPGIGYLVRRLLENTSNSSFLRLSYHDNEDEDKLLARPQPTGEEKEKHTMARGDTHTPFENCPLTDFTDPDKRRKFEEALAKVAASFPLKIPFIVSGEEHYDNEPFERYSPGDGKTLVATVSPAGKDAAEMAVTETMGAWPDWRDRPLEERADCLERLADLMERDRYRLAALQVYEVGKPWGEADGDVAEAIDFCRYYARQSLKELASEKRGNLPGEENIMFYEGRGPAVVIAPWNFPLAILCGMTTAALVTGNTVIIKPSGLANAVAYSFYKSIISAGVPKEAVHFLPGAGSDVGDFLVNHPFVAQIAFTGSKEVGLGIVEQSAKTAPGQPQVKRVVCEMGGKNAIIVDEDADLDDAVSGIVTSAFGYAGQKCSACSRVIVIEDIYDIFIKRLVEACRSVLVEPPWMPSCRLGPVVSRESRDRLRALIENPGNGAKALFVGEAPDNGYYVPPAVFEVPGTGHPLMQDELFGPILAVMKVKTFDDALKAAVSIEFALTGGVYSRSPINIATATRKFRVGNLYINRWITGAIVDRQPFGGFRMSGIGTKAGGPGYLLHFADPRCVTENTMQRGFVPEMEWLDQSE